MASPPTSYIFSRNYRSSIRLNYQHALVTKLAGNQLLHPAIRAWIDPSTSLHVADIGTGTAIWPAELAESLPDSHVEGFDLSTDQYPAWLPESVTLHQHDTFQPFPPEHQGVYDIVNLRFFITLLNAENLPLLLRNVMSLLKPGGFFQWLDLDPRSVQPIATDPTVPLTQARSVAALMQGIPLDVASWLTDNGDMLKPAGFEPLVSDRLQLKDLYRPLWNHSLLMGMEELCYTLETSQTDPAKAQTMRQNLEQLSGEFAQGASIDAQWFYLVAQKPV
ncbi:S-adenosyl-L-methionine-dependent methyltransferase [Aspergillus ellipticus CBS 707.79]|uniref:S-adenosyl-L-methionine-dependent methyltransferase n=1 Tax=Aspergillus ellipticus CBS 707.79 TaxID=1448320 RepID=A0A319EKS4_9EURO|nr:S-adenosyl-L-methionine-dependent methyltransferase [Aspergillus ellipticus CBS 707.79]